MSDAPILQRHPALRWLAPAGVLCIAGLAATGALGAHATSGPSNLPGTTPARLIAAAQSSGTDVSDFSGTVLSQLDLGLPDLSGLDSASDSTSPTSLLTGSHTLQVWYGGPTRQRVALLGSTEETDVFRDGSDLWQWDSAHDSAVRTGLPEVPTRSTAVPSPAPTESLTPGQLAHRAMAAIGPSTKVTVRDGREVADRRAYELVLTPRSAATTVGSVRIALDGVTKMPLAVRVYARGASTPAIDVAYTSIRFATQPERNFQFTPPPGARVRTVQASTSDGLMTLPQRVRRSGDAWTTVLDIHLPATSLRRLAHSQVLDSLPAVAGTWGKGHLLSTPLVSALLTSDGRLYAGAVRPASLFAAAAR